MERAIAHVIVGVAAGAVVRQMMPGAGPGHAVAAGLAVAVLHEAFDAPLAVRLRAVL